MHRDPLLSLLEAYRPYDARDREACGLIERFVRAHADCFERTLEEGHVTASAWIVDESRRRCLLTHHRKLGRWLQLGGHTDGDSDTLGSALREAREESGLTRLAPASASIFDCDVHRIPARGAEPEHWHYDVRYLVVADASEPVVVSAESKELAWVELADVARLAPDPSVLRMVSKTPRA